MKKILTLLFSLLFTASFAQDVQRCSGANDTKGMPDGAWNCKYPDGKTRNELTYKSGILHGVRKEYFEDGTLRLDATYLESELDGVVKEYYPNGQLKFQGTFSRGLPKGVHTEYSEEGKETQQHDFK